MYTHQTRLRVKNIMKKSGGRIFGQEIAIKWQLTVVATFWL